MFTIYYGMSYGKGDSSDTFEYEISDDVFDEITDVVATMLGDGRFPTEDSPELSDIFDRIRDEIQEECENILAESGDSFYEECLENNESVFDNGYSCNIDVSVYELDEDEAETYFNAVFENGDNMDEFFDIFDRLLGETETGWDYLQTAFDIAVDKDNIEFVAKYVSDMEFDCMDDYGASYLDRAQSNEMTELLMDNGIIPDDDYFFDYPFAVSSNEGEIISFDSNFQKEAFKKYKEKYGLKDEDIVNILEYAEEWETEDKSTDDIQNDMEYLGIGVDNDKIEYIYKSSDMDGYELRDLLEELGYEVSFAGDSWKLDTAGVWYIEEY